MIIILKYNRKRRRGVEIEEGQQRRKGLDWHEKEGEIFSLWPFGRFSWAQ